MKNFFIKPSIGVWLGSYNGNKDGEKEAKGSGGLVLGEWILQLGLLSGAIVGIGKKFGVYSGLMGAFSIIPFLALGFIGLPMGIHYKQRIGIGIIIPIKEVEPLIGLIVGAVVFILTMVFFKNKR